MNAIQTFDFESQAVRSLLRDDEPWFVAADVCRVLDIANPRDAVSKLDDDEKTTVANTDGRAGHGAQSYNIISESGLYALIFTSRKPEAKKFRKFVTSEVLPTLRRTGQFIMDETDEDLPSIAHGRLWGQPVAKINAAARMIGVASRIYGPDAARALWEREKGLPKLNKFSVIATTGNANNDARGCWYHMMRQAVGPSRTIGTMLDLAIHDKIVAKSLRDYGLFLDPQEANGMLAIASKNRFLSSIFATTQWCDDWRLALAKLPGARPSKGTIRFGNSSSRAVLVPHETITRLKNLVVN